MQLLTDGTVMSQSSQLLPGDYLKNLKAEKQSYISYFLMSISPRRSRRRLNE